MSILLPASELQPSRYARAVFFSPPDVTAFDQGRCEGKTVDDLTLDADATTLPGVGASYIHANLGDATLSHVAWACIEQVYVPALARDGRGMAIVVLAGADVQCDAFVTGTMKYLSGIDDCPERIDLRTGQIQGDGSVIGIEVPSASCSTTRREQAEHIDRDHARLEEMMSGGSRGYQILLQSPVDILIIGDTDPLRYSIVPSRGDDWCCFFTSQEILDKVFQYLVDSSNTHTEIAFIHITA